MQTPIGWRVAAGASVVLVLCGCDRRTAEEKGRDLATEKIDLAKGAADVLKEKGGALGKSAGQGLGELVKGIGSGVKDVAHPPVTVELEASALSSGIASKRASEGGEQGASRTIEVYAAFGKPFKGRLELRAFDAQGAELGLGTCEKHFDAQAGSNETAVFAFPSSIRFSQAKLYKLSATTAAAFALHESAAGLDVSQISENAPNVSAYVKFGNKFDGVLELRAFDAAGAELGRSAATDKLKQAADSASYVDFKFDPRTPLARVAKYELRAK